MYKEKYPMLTYYNYNKFPFSKAFHIFLVGHHYEAPVVTLSVTSLKAIVFDDPHINQVVC